MSNPDEEEIGRMEAAILAAMNNPEVDARVSNTVVDATVGDSRGAFGGVDSGPVVYRNRTEGADVDETAPSCQIAPGQRVWFVEGVEPEDDRLLLTDERTGSQVFIDHAAWNALLGAVAYFQVPHCEVCPNVFLNEPNDFVFVPGLD
jgi:hypothetical protein